MTGVPITSDLVGYMVFWRPWLLRFLVVHLLILVLLVLIWRK